MIKTMSQLDKNGVFISSVIADESPLEPGVFLVPSGAVDLPPPDVPAGKFAKWNGAAFDLKDIPEPEPEPEPEPPTTEQIEKTYIAAVQAVMDAEAQAHGYDDVVSACSYAGYANAFQAEGLSFGQWRASIWVYGYAEMAKIKAGTRALPTIEAFLAELPTRALP